MVFVNRVFYRESGHCGDRGERGDQGKRGDRGDRDESGELYEEYDESGELYDDECVLAVYFGVGGQLTFLLPPHHLRHLRHYRMVLRQPTRHRSPYRFL